MAGKDRALTLFSALERGLGKDLLTFLRTGARPTRAAELTRRNFTSGILKPEDFSLVL